MAREEYDGSPTTRYHAATTAEPEVVVGGVREHRQVV
jgi:hypothetical protein